MTRRIHTLVASIKAFDQHRRFIREGPIKQQGHKRKRYFYLFNDTLLVCKVNVTERKVFEDDIGMKDLLIDNMQDSTSMFRSFQCTSAPLTISCTLCMRTV